MIQSSSMAARESVRLKDRVPSQLPNRKVKPQHAATPGFKSPAS